MRDYTKITKPTPEKYCEYCGAKLERKRYGKRIEDYNVFLRRKYCNRDCMRKSYVKKDGGQLYTPAHKSAREIMYLIGQREKVCELCGATKSIDVHHKDGDYKNNSLDNLMIVCRSCHMKLHHPKSKCKICGAPVKGHGLCEKHLIRLKRHGSPFMYYGKIRKD